jgi:hypothetical protein
LSSYLSSSQLYSNDLEVRLSNLAPAELPPELEDAIADPQNANARTQHWQMFAAAACLVCLPVFVQAPLVRIWPWLSLCGTLPLVWLSLRLRRHPTLTVWGDLLLGFSWTWLAGSLYWGWLRWEPFVHLPIEAIGLPFAVADLTRGQNRLGNWFYLGSLFGTAMTDFYFYLVKLIPFWRQVMQVEPSLAQSILHEAVGLVQTPWGIGCAVGLLGILLTVGLWPLRSNQLAAWAFGGAVLSTIVVDGLFWLGASMV